jgi:hypothetical protein
MSKDLVEGIIDSSLTGGFSLESFFSVMVCLTPAIEGRNMFLKLNAKSKSTVFALFGSFLRSSRDLE